MLGAFKGTWQGLVGTPIAGVSPVPSFEETAHQAPSIYIATLYTYLAPQDIPYRSTGASVVCALINPAPHIDTGAWAGTDDWKASRTFSRFFSSRCTPWGIRDGSTGARLFAALYSASACHERQGPGSGTEVKIEGLLGGLLFFPSQFPLAPTITSVHSPPLCLASRGKDLGQG